ncbi:hypothetical protein [Leuconostoc mesenteroides]|uniref:hypothetical protein n=1 Tax=Leuconostoc mesenteroides TaxID=1245 RepID=UPI0035CEDC65
MANTQKVAGLITMSYADAANLIATDIPLVSIEKKFPIKCHWLFQITILEDS